MLNPRTLRQRHSRMRTKRCLLVALLCFITLTAATASAETSPSLGTTARLGETLSTLCPGAYPVKDTSRQADLDGDGIADISVLVECPAGSDRRLVVLKGSANGTLHLLAQSATWPTDPNRWDGLVVQNDVLIYQQGCNASCSEPTSLDYKFRYSKGSLVLIGQEQRHMWRDTENGKEIQVDTGVSVNYLSRRVIYFGNRGAKHFKHALSFGLLPLVPLSGFDADKIDEQHRQVRALSGYVDANLVLHLLD